MMMEQNLNSKLEETKNNVTVTNALFADILEQCGPKMSSSANVIEPFLSLDTFIFYDNIEVERIEVQNAFLLTMAVHI